MALLDEDLEDGRLSEGVSSLAGLKRALDDHSVNVFGQDRGRGSGKTAAQTDQPDRQLQKIS